MPATDTPHSSDALRPETRAYLDRAALSHRKSLGQYFTPRDLRQRLLDRVPLAAGMRVLDPGAGTGEFLLDVRERCPTAQVIGFDVDPELVAIGRAHGLDVRLHDFLAANPAPDFDLVIGNPPYFELPASDERVHRFASVVSGRPNAFALFFAAGLAALKPGGRLAFVVSPSLNNGAYFAALRRHVLEHAAIESLELLPSATRFDAAQQSVMAIVLVKGERADRHVFRARLDRGEEPLFMERPEALAELLDGHATLADLGYLIRTGRCVWNQRKGDLRREREAGAVPLIWAHNIGDGVLTWTPEHPKRPQYVVEAKPDVGPAIVVNRITGSVGGGRLRAAAVPAGFGFVGENHVNVVARVGGVLFEAGRAESEVLAGLRSERASAAMRLLTGNTQLSATELGWLIPVVAREMRGEDAG